MVDRRVGDFDLALLFERVVDLDRAVVLLGRDVVFFLVEAGFRVVAFFVAVLRVPVFFRDEVDFRAVVLRVDFAADRVLVFPLVDFVRGLALLFAFDAVVRLDFVAVVFFAGLAVFFLAVVDRLVVAFVAVEDLERVLPRAAIRPFDGTLTTLARLRCDR